MCTSRPFRAMADHHHSPADANRLLGFIAKVQAHDPLTDVELWHFARLTFSPLRISTERDPADTYQARRGGYMWCSHVHSRPANRWRARLLAILEEPPAAVHHLLSSAPLMNPVLAPSQPNLPCIWPWPFQAQALPEQLSVHDSFSTQPLSPHAPLGTYAWPCSPAFSCSLTAPPLFTLTATAPAHPLAPGPSAPPPLFPPSPWALDLPTAPEPQPLASVPPTPLWPFSPALNVAASAQPLAPAPPTPALSPSPLEMDASEALAYVTTLGETDVVPVRTLLICCADSLRLAGHARGDCKRRVRLYAYSSKQFSQDPVKISGQRARERVCSGPRSRFTRLRRSCVVASSPHRVTFAAACTTQLGICLYNCLGPSERGSLSN